VTRLRVAAAQINTVVGDLVGNAERVLEAYEQAAGDRCDLVVFPELTATGYPPFGATYAPSSTVGYALSGASYFPVRIQAIDEGARGDRVIEPQYVAPRPRNQ
jgi:NAD+ synthase (glutamine-hydrolysing)